MNHHLLLSAVYVLPLALGIWLYFAGKQKRRIRILLLSLLPLLYLFHWFALQESEGWPSDRALPERFELISADIREADRRSGEEGLIHLWIRPEDSLHPRSHVLPYSRELHKMLFETKKRIDQGYTQVGMLYEGASTGKGVSLGSGLRLEFRDLPGRRLPPKPAL